MRMNERTMGSGAWFVESIDIENMNKWSPEQKVGVSVNRIYIQIAKYSSIPNKTEELILLSDAISKIESAKTLYEPKYVPMKVCDVFKCFEKCLKKLPKSTFRDLPECTGLKVYR